MKSASQMSMLIRAKKKKMQDDPDVIDSGNSPSMDLQDELIADQNQETKRLGLDHNHPMEQSSKEWMDDQNPKPEMEAPLSKEERMMAEGGEVQDMKEMDDMKPMDEEQVNKVIPQVGDDSEALQKRRARLAKMMGR